MRRSCGWRAPRASSSPQARTTYPDLEFRLTGGVMLDAAFSDSAESDIRILTPIMLTVSIGLIGYFLGSLWATLVTTAVIAGSIVCALGWAGYLGIALSPSSLGAPTILMTMAVADSVHFLTGYYARFETTGDRIEAMVHSLVRPRARGVLHQRGDDRQLPDVELQRRAAVPRPRQHHGDGRRRRVPAVAHAAAGADYVRARERDASGGSRACSGSSTGCSASSSERRGRSRRSASRPASS